MRKPVRERTTKNRAVGRERNLIVDTWLRGRELMQEVR